MDLIGTLVIWLGVPLLFLYFLSKLGILKFLNKFFKKRKVNRKWK